MAITSFWRMIVEVDPRRGEGQHQLKRDKKRERERKHRRRRRRHGEKPPAQRVSTMRGNVKRPSVGLPDEEAAASGASEDDDEDAGLKGWRVYLLSQLPHLRQIRRCGRCCTG